MTFVPRIRAPQSVPPESGDMTVARAQTNRPSRLILGLAAGERSSVFAVASPNGWRATVASWYLRLRESPDPLWGLVRVEMSMPASGHRRALGERAEQVSRWVLAETSPLALPDGRWDTMAYGVRDCEQYLKASIR